MDINKITQIIPAKNCARTNGSDTIDGDTVTGVQVWTDTEDDGSSAETYIGPGEVVITDASGLALDNTTDYKDVDEMAIHWRTYDGQSTFSTQRFKPEWIKSYNFKEYKAAQEQVVEISGIDGTLQDYTYTVKFQKMPSNKRGINNGLHIKTVTYTTGASDDAETIATGLAEAINKEFAQDNLMPLTATQIGTGAGAAVLITGNPLPYETGVIQYDVLRYDVTGTNFDCTIKDNIGEEFDDVDATTHSPYTKGNGTWQQVAEMEFQSLIHAEGANRDLNLPLHRRRGVVALSTQKYEDDGSTINRYDIITLNWKYSDGALSQSSTQSGSIVLALPLDDNATSQADNIVAALNKAFVTDYAIRGTAVTLS